MYKRLGAFVLAAVVLPAGWVAAQERRQVGLAMGYPASVAVIFHATDSFAVRPEFNFSTSSSTTSSTSSSATNDNNSFGVGVSALFYAAKWENLCAYFSPRFAYAHGTSDYTTSAGSTSSSRSSTYSVTGSFGAQYGLGRRFAVFGEVGLGYGHATVESSYDPTYMSPSSTSTGNSWSTRTAIGGIFYFK